MVIIMNTTKMEYIKSNLESKKLLRTELLFTPVLILVPSIVSIFLINDWYVRGFMQGNAAFDGELMLGIIIFIGNMLFDIPFLRFLVKKRRVTE